VMLQMGTDDPTSGNTVTWMRSEAMGSGVNAGNCLVRASFQYNTISDCNNGLAIEGQMAGPTPGPAHLYSIKHNTFARMTHQGLIAAGESVFIDEVSDNRFFDITRIPNSTYSASAMHVWAPVVGKVRRNVFVGNDFGLVLGEGTDQTDVGRPGDPGGNAFSCNAGIDDWSGADVTVVYPAAPESGGVKSQRGPRFVGQADGGLDRLDGGLDGSDEGGDAETPRSLFFAGNSWDHDPPRLMPGDVADNGVEIRLDSAPPLRIDVSGSLLVTSPCPPGRKR
jgi:hypothetical protein